MYGFGAKKKTSNGSPSSNFEHGHPGASGERKLSETRLRKQEPSHPDIFDIATLKRRTSALAPPPQESIESPRDRISIEPPVRERSRSDNPTLLGLAPSRVEPASRASWSAGRELVADVNGDAVPFGNETAGATLLSAVAGYVDAAGFLLLFGMFTAHITGDLVAGSAIVGEHFPKGFGMKVAPVPIFMLSVAVATLLTRAARRRGGAPLVSLLGLMTIALAVFGTAGILLRPFMHAADNWAVAVVGSTGVAAMAIQNLLMRDVLSGWSPTTIMTGNLTRVSIHIVDYAFPPEEANTMERAEVRDEATSNLLKFGLPLVGFVGGGALSAWLTSLFGFYSIGLPTLVVALMTLWQWRRVRR